MSSTHGCDATVDVWNASVRFMYRVSMRWLLEIGEAPQTAFDNLSLIVGSTTDLAGRKGWALCIPLME